MKKSLFLFTFISLCTHWSLAQTPGPGSLLFIAFQNNAPDGFAIVLMQDFPGNQVVSFTDNGWSGTELFTNEQTIVWTLPPTGLPAGTTVRFADNQAGATTITPASAGSVTGVLDNLSSAGEQILAYTGPATSPSFLAGISSSQWLATCNTTGAGNTNSTCLPAPLQNGSTAFAFTNTSTAISNGFFNLPSFLGSPSELITLIMNASNWVLSNSAGQAGNQVWPNWNFNFGGLPANAIIQFSAASGSMPLANGQFVVNLTITPGAFSNSNATIQVTASNGLNPADYDFMPAANNNNITIPILQNQTAATIVVNVDPNADIFAPQTLQLTLTNTSSDLLVIGNTSSFVLTIIPPQITIQPLFINELMAQNFTTIADEFGEFDDWIEIFNPNNVEVDLAGLFISDNPAQPDKYRFPTGSATTIIPANGFKLIWADNQSGQGPLHTNFALSVNGEFVGLYAADGSTVIDTITFGPQSTDVSLGRNTDGGLPWVLFTTPTPGSSNNPTALWTVNKAMGLQLFPNPAVEQLQWTLPATANAQAIQLAVCDLQGRLLLSMQTTELKGTLNVSHLPSGMYVLKAQQQEQIQNLKFIKQ